MCASRPELRPAEFDRRDAWRFRASVALWCVFEAWALVFGSGILWHLGLRYPIWLGSMSVGPAIVGGMQIEQWLEIMSGRPILDEDGAINSPPTLWSVAYVLPPFTASMGGYAVAFGSWYVAAAACMLSLVVFGWLMLRIRRIWNGRRLGCG